MLPSAPHPSGRALSLVLLILGATATLGSAAFAQGHAASSAHVHGSMSTDDMRRWVQDFYATHPTVGGLRPAAVADTFLASAFTFDNGGAGSVDTAFVTTGQTVLWIAESGTHTVTNGTGSTDPNVGTLFDAPIDPITTPRFAYTFNTPGTIRFFCRQHESFNMRGVVRVTDPVAADTFLTVGLQFDTDGSAATQVDTAHVDVGAIVLFISQGLEFHTVTNGTGALDPDAGQLFDAPLDPDHQTLVLQFDVPGIYDFFCRPHEFDEMKGVVVVGNPVGVNPGPVAGNRIGFATEPIPNPTRGTIGFRLAMPLSGRAKVEVFDVRGKLVAVPLDRSLEAGSFDVTWNGDTRAGTRAVPGVYHLRLTLPGYTAMRRIVLTL